MNQQVVSEPEHPGFIDALIIFFVAAAIVIFLFWVATTVSRIPLFAALPPYVSSAFSSIWSSLATGATGIGLAAFRALSNRYRESPRPNYLWLIFLTVAGLLLLIIVLLVVIRFVVTPPPSPSNGRIASARDNLAALAKDQDHALRLRIESTRIPIVPVVCSQLKAQFDSFLLGSSATSLETLPVDASEQQLAKYQKQMTEDFQQRNRQLDGLIAMARSQNCI